MMQVATYMPELAKATSFFQVEFGMDELIACWDGFVHTSDHHEQRFSSKIAICKEFTDALSDYAEFIQEPASHQVGT
jgi:hypothetical protein